MRYINHIVQFAETNDLVIEVSENGIITGVELPNPYGDELPEPKYMAHDGGFAFDNRRAKAMVGTKYQPHELDEDASAYIKNVTFYRG